MKLPFLRTAYNYDRNAASKKSGLHCKDKSLAQQQFAEESDINYIANQYGLSGEIPTVLNLPRSGDFTGIFDFQQAQNAVRLAIEQFNALPAKLRNRFDNKPQKLIDFLDDPENNDEAIRLGLVNKPKSTPGDGAPAAGGNPTPPTKGAPEPAPRSQGQTDKTNNTDT